MSRRDLTRSGLLGSLLVLALPLVANSLVGGVAFQLIDLAFVSRLGDDATTAVIVTNQSLRQVLLMLVMGASFGAQGLIARAVGSGVQQDADRVAGQVLVLGIGLSLVVAVIGVAFARPLLASMNVAPSVLEVGVPYVRLVFALAFGMILSVLFSSVLNGAGDTTTTFVVALVQTLVALGAEWVLVFGHLGLPPLGVPGIALGISTGQIAGLALAGYALFGEGGRIQLRLRDLRPDPALLRRITALAWPPALQMLGGFLVTVVFLRRMGDFSATAQTAYSIGLRVGMVGPMLAFPVAGACATLVGQALGAGNPRRAWQAIGLGIAVHAVILGGVALGLVLYRERILSWLSSDPEVVRLGSEVMLFQAGNFAAWAFYFVFFRSLQGAGDVRVPMLLSVGCSLVVTLPLGYALADPLGPTGIFAASLVGSVVVTLATGGWLATGRWARRGPVTPVTQAREASLR